MKSSMFRSAAILTLVCLIAAALLGTAYTATAERIEQQSIIALKQSLNQVCAEADDFKDEGDYYVALKDNNIVGFVAIAESQGYSSIIKIIVGMDINKEITGIRVLDHAETPGLGANIVKPGFYTQFDRLSLSDIALRKDNGRIDGITAATISSIAVAEGVRSVIEDKLENLVDNNNNNQEEQTTGEGIATRTYITGSEITESE